MDQTAIPSTSLNCTQCGGELHPDEGQIFLTCPYCSSTVYLDKSQVVFHWYVAATLDADRARGALARWMSGNETVKDLDKKARLAGIQFEYFPLWYFKRRQPASGQKTGKEEILLEPAAATSITEMRQVHLPAGDLRKYDSSLDSQSRPPSVPLTAALAWLTERKIASSELAERALVHVPFFTCKYEYQGKTYTTVVDAATGKVFANIFPAKAETPYQTIGIITALVYLCLAMLPVGGALMNEEGLLIGLLVCSGLGLVAAPLLMALAAWIATKV